MIKNNQVYSGAFELTLNGAKLPEEIASVIKEVTVEENLNQATRFSFRIESGDFLKKLVQDKFDLDKFKPGDEVKISMGFDQMEPLITGEISSVEPNFQEPFSMEIRGYDRLYRLTLLTKRFSYANQKDSDIASTIAGEMGLSADVEDTGITYPLVFQNNQSHYDFLLGRANRIGYEMMVNDKTLSFRKPQDDKKPEVSLSYGTDIQNFSVHMQAVPAESKVEVRSWDVKTKKVITYSAESNLSSQAKKELFPSSSSSPLVLHEVAMDTADAEKIAKARMNEMINNLITGEGKYSGQPKIRAGRSLNIDGIGTRLSGIYYITAATHTINDEGYTTSFKVRKTGA